MSDKSKIETETYRVKILNSISIPFDNFADGQPIDVYHYKEGDKIEIEVAHVDEDKGTVNLIVQDIQDNEGIAYDVPIDTFELLEVMKTDVVWEAV